ncbi:hypothetical protein CAPTEDRAFT_186498 [Capitella teleta]|uniref:DH domain-containing protein n=1 Tax=Capitella teleta TaxID=283909 RepID=R7V1U5_CAPTE|nr:hypothetical protein CAPTEDRAFT_186498 [Capitella teleta]|eukprot:ELU12818.1 hypothetical protein CAPTEDRAFT_186498 [Capitella teleta]
MSFVGNSLKIIHKHINNNALVEIHDGQRVVLVIMASPAKQARLEMDESGDEAVHSDEASTQNSEASSTESSDDSLLDVSDEYSFNDIPSDSDEEINEEKKHIPEPIDPVLHQSTELSMIVEEEGEGSSEGSSPGSSEAGSSEGLSYSDNEIDGALSVVSSDEDEEEEEEEENESDESDLLKQILNSIDMSQYSTLDWTETKAEDLVVESKDDIEKQQQREESPQPIHRSYSQIPTATGSLMPKTIPVVRNHLEDILVRSMCGPDAEDVFLKRTPGMDKKPSKTPLTSTPNPGVEKLDLEESVIVEKDIKVNVIEEKMAKRRLKITQEILDSERTYQNHLHLIVKCFEFPLRKAAVIPDRVISSIFGNVRQILTLNQELLLKLEEEGGLGLAFLQMAPFLKLYSMYANNHEKALATLMEWDQKCPEFGAFRRQQESLSEMNGLKLNALLITPVQRIPRYKLLLTDLLANTLKDSDDYKALEGMSEAVQVIGDVAAHINEHIKQQDNFKRVLQIQKSLSGGAAPRLLAPGRVIIKEGLLKKVSRKAGRSHDRLFYLFSDLLMYTKPRLLEGTTLQTQTCCCVFPLAHCKVMRVFGNAAGQGSLFTIQCKEQSVLLYSDHRAVDEWIQVINKAIRELKENRKSLRKASTSSTHNSPFPPTPVMTKSKSNERSFTSPTSTLKRVFMDNDVNCLSPKKNKDSVKGSFWGRSRSMSGLKKKVPAEATDVTPEQDWRHKRRYPSTPSALDGIDQQEIIDLDESEAWHYEQSTLSTQSNPSTSSVNNPCLMPRSLGDERSTASLKKSTQNDGCSLQ